MESEGSMLLQIIDNAVEIRYLQVCGKVSEIREILRGHAHFMNDRTIEMSEQINDLRHSNTYLWAVIFFMIIERISVYYF